MSSTFERLCAIVVAQHKLPPERLTDEATLESLGIDSLGIVELLWNVEDAFRIKLPAAPVDLRTLGDVARHVDELVAAQSAAAASGAAAAPVAPGLRSS